jgi:peroxiredoxin (alkyl hydroperoxide reductase subunit C)
MSTDTDVSHKQFIAQSFSKNNPLLFPLATDVTRSVSRHFNVINSEIGTTQRAAFVIDRTRQVRFSFIIEDRRLNHSMHTICTILQTL